MVTVVTVMAIVTVVTVQWSVAIPQMHVRTPFIAILEQSSPQVDTSPYHRYHYHHSHD
jgi:hypothetical protein